MSKDIIDLPLVRGLRILEVKGHKLVVVHCMVGVKSCFLFICGVHLDMIVTRICVYEA